MTNKVWRAPRATVTPNAHGLGWTVETTFDVPLSLSDPATKSRFFRWKWRAVRHGRRWVKRQLRIIERERGVTTVTIRPARAADQVAGIVTETRAQLRNEQLEALAVRGFGCGSCGAVAGEPCRSVFGVVLASHPSRMHLAVAQAGSTP